MAFPRRRRRRHIAARSDSNSIGHLRETSMRKSVALAAAGAAALMVSSPAPIVAQGDTDQQLGNVHFQTSCNDVAQRRFDRAMRYQHSFWYDAGRDIFQEAAKADPECGMAYWGVALTYLDN